MNKHKWEFIALLILAMLAGCSPKSDQRETEQLSATVAALETSQAQHLEWISYQATQIGANRELLNALATNQSFLPKPQNATPTPYTSAEVSGSVTIEENACCVGSTAGDTIRVAVQFEASSTYGAVTEMRVVTGVPSITNSEFMNIPWEPFVEEKEYPLSVPTNWTSFWVHVQYRDKAGSISEIFSDDIAVEGMPPQPTETPQP